MTKKTEGSETTAFSKGVLAGIITARDLHYETAKRLKQSIDDVMNIHLGSEVLTKDKQDAVQKLQYARDTLTAFQELFDSEYEEKMDELQQKALEEMPEYLSTEWPED